jgi:hypothetical protein
MIVFKERCSPVDYEMTDENVLMTLQNSRKPELIIHVVRNVPNACFETRGLKRLFGVEEIRVNQTEMAVAMPDYAQVLSFLVETMSAARDLGLPYVYQDLFEFADTKYSLYGGAGYRLLSKVAQENETL